MRDRRESLLVEGLALSDHPAIRIGMAEAV